MSDVFEQVKCLQESENENFIMCQIKSGLYFSDLPLVVVDDICFELIAFKDIFNDGLRFFCRIFGLLGVLLRYWKKYVAP